MYNLIGLISTNDLYKKSFFSRAKKTKYSVVAALLGK